MDKTRVLIIATTNLGFEGITSVIMNYYRNINRDKIQFDFVVGEEINEEIEREIRELGGRIYKLPSRKRQTLKYLSELKKVIKDNDYKIIHAHGNSGTLFLDIHVAKKLNVPMRIAHSHTSSGNHKIIHKILKSKLNKEITHSIACSQLAGEWLFNKDYIVLNNGIDIEKFEFNEAIREEYRKKMNLQDKFVIGHIGHFSPSKNHEYLIDVFKEVYNKNSDARLLLVGDGALKKDIEDKIIKLNLERKVVLLERRKDISNIMQAMDVFVFPSKFEGLPVVVVEVQANGLKALISSNITRECQITDRVKFLDLSENKEEWVNEIFNINPKYIRNNVKEEMMNSKFNIKNEAKKLEDIYLSINN